MNDVAERTFELEGTPFVAHTQHAGTGPDLVVLPGALHGPWGDFHSELAADFTVYRFSHPAWDLLEDLDQFDNIWDLVLYYLTMIEALGLTEPTIVGHGFGGMVAAEIVAADSRIASRIVLIAPFGLWRDDRPVVDLWGLSPRDRDAVLWEAPPDRSDEPYDQDGLLAAFLTETSATHFIWPIPDLNLARRLYRVKTPTTVIWGSGDQVISADYLELFQSYIPHAETVLIENGSHLVHVERPAEVASVIKQAADS